jgi:hypothetical protein
MEEVTIIHPGMDDQIDLINQLVDRKFISIIVFSALSIMQEDPSLEPYEAFALGLREWTK